MIEPGMGEVIVEAAQELWTINGVRRLGTNLLVNPEIVEQYRTGWRCLRCHAPQEEAFPEICIEGSHPDKICSYPIRRDQLRHFEKDYQGERYCPADDYDDEREDWVRKNGILVPRAVD